MPRMSRKKHPFATYHIIAKSIKELFIFNSREDKEKYLQIIKKYQDIFLFKVYAFCIMDNHAHLIIHSCGADISKIMKGINQSYAQYYNKKYARSGPIFNGRFKSLIVFDDRYLLTLSAYIHNNPKNIKKFKNNVEEYKFSSLSIYINKSKDKYNLVDRTYILNKFSLTDINLAKKRYIEYVKERLGDNIEKSYDINKEHNLDNKTHQYEIKRDFKGASIIEFVSKTIGLPNWELKIKYQHKSTVFKSLCVFLMRCLSNLTYKEICTYIGNITCSQISYLCTKGYNLIHHDPLYNNLLNKFINEYAC